MAFSRSLDTKAMTEFVVRRFQWDRDFLCDAFQCGQEARGAAWTRASIIRGSPDCAGEHLSCGLVVWQWGLRGSKELLGIACAVNMAFPPTHSTREMANYVREAFAWRGRNVARPPCALPEDFNVLCSHFSLAEVETTAAESGMPEIVQATFYAMPLNEVLELGVVHEYTAENMRPLLVGLRWSDFELYRLPDEVEIKGARNSRGEAVGVAVLPVPLSDDE
ncbi:hypothetical protein Cgig2_007485 [Carnegiea gigantea]|uniref:Uncharacterized protein n=1 Tax=Carnegiea gigantea TaxID=171969 RepID=A0A9Q1K6Z4_9CARY|nr:hypothetical protein Cgig2_007485 [Carnegiea gigantea]